VVLQLVEPLLLHSCPLVEPVVEQASAVVEARLEVEVEVELQTAALCCQSSGLHLHPCPCPCQQARCRGEDLPGQLHSLDSHSPHRESRSFSELLGLAADVQKGEGAQVRAGPNLYQEGFFLPAFPHISGIS
jgi:hypothetical protein